jgi:hypothetical protein
MAMFFKTHRTLNTDYLLAFSISHLLLVQAWFSILYDCDQGYFNHLRVTPVVLLALLSALALLALPIAAAIRCWRGHSAHWFRVAMAVIAILILLPPLNFIRFHVAHIHAGVIYKWMASPWCLLPALSAGAVILLRPAWVAGAWRVLAVVLFPSAALNIVKIILVILGLQKIHQHDVTPALASRFAVTPAAPRVVWVILDELDERVTFEERPADVALPCLDRFREHSLACTQAYPPANGTMLSMPALLTGRQVFSAEPRNASELNLTFAPNGSPEGWSGQSNLFSMARAAGINCGLAAWYHPYDRLFARYLTDCFSYPFPLFEQARGRTFGEAMLNQFFAMVSPLQQRRLAIRLYQASTDSACRLVSDPGLGLVFLHLQGPHRPGIYDPPSGRYTWWSFSTAKEYLDNLVLTDLTLRRLQESMTGAGLWDSSWVIISADHCWRESEAVDGKCDLRVPFMIKPPGAAWGGRFGKKMNTVLSCDLILSMLRGVITGGEDLVASIDRHRSEADPVGRRDSR